MKFSYRRGSFLRSDWGLGAAFTFFFIAVFALPTLATTNCTTYFNHSGFIPGSYDYANFYESGFEPVTVYTNGQNINVPPPPGRNSWDKVEKCLTTTTTSSTTTSTSTTVTTVPESSTTTSPTTTTSVALTTTTVGTTTTTGGTTSTSVPTSTTTPDTSTTAVTPILPVTGADLSLLVLAAFFVIGLGWLLIVGKERK